MKKKTPHLNFSLFGLPRSHSTGDIVISFRRGQKPGDEEVSSWLPKWDPFSISHKHPSSQKLLAEHHLRARPCAAHCGYSKCKVKALSSKAAELQGKAARPSGITAKPWERCHQVWKEKRQESKWGFGPRSERTKDAAPWGAAGSDPPGDTAPGSAGLESRVRKWGKGKGCQEGETGSGGKTEAYQTWRQGGWPAALFPGALLTTPVAGSTRPYWNRTQVPWWMSHLDVGAVVQQIQVGGECAGVWLWGKAQQRRALHVHSPGVDGAPGPPQGAVAKDGLNGLGKQRLQGGEKASRRRKELLHVAFLLPGLCFQRVGKKIHHFWLQTNWAGVGLW